MFWCLLKKLFCFTIGLWEVQDYVDVPKKKKNAIEKARFAIEHLLISSCFVKQIVDILQMRFGRWQNVIKKLVDRRKRTKSFVAPKRSVGCSYMRFVSVVSWDRRVSVNLMMMMRAEYAVSEITTNNRSLFPAPLDANLEKFTSYWKIIEFTRDV